MPRHAGAGVPINLFDVQPIQVDPASFSKKRKRNNTACVRCHERKIKCDAGSLPRNTPCRNCVSTSSACVMHVDGRTRASSVQAVQAVQAVEADQADQTVQADLGHSDDDGDRHKPGAHVGDSNPGSYAPSLRSNLELPPPPPPPPAKSTSSTLSDDAALAAAVLSSFTPSHSHHECLETPAWEGEEQRERQEEEEEQEEATADLDAADVAYLEAKGAFALPGVALQAELIEAFFRDVHPTAPVVNRAAFLGGVRHRGRGRGHGSGRRRPPSRLLLFAMFTAAARVCRSAALLDSGGTNHASARRFYRAAKALLDTGHERSRLAVVQALLLLSGWGGEEGEEGKKRTEDGTRRCAVDAIHTAQSLGMHRWDQYPKGAAAAAETGLWKRIWWSCVNRDVAVAVAHGLPCMLSLDETDVPPLTPDDFVEADGDADGNPDGDAEGAVAASASYTEAEIHYMLEQTRVCEALRHIHSRYVVQPRLQPRMTGSLARREAEVAAAAAAAAHSIRWPRPDDGDGDNDAGLRLCRAWLGRVPAAVQYDVDDVQGHRFWPAFLHILFYTNILLRFREASVAGGRLFSPTGSPAAVAAERRYGLARGIAAATLVSKIVRNMRAHGHLLRCPGQLTSSLFHCLLFFLVEGHLAAGAAGAVREDARRKYTLCLSQLYEFSQLWRRAARVHRLFEALQARLLQPSSSSSSSRGAEAGRGDHELFPGFRTSNDLPQAYVHQLVCTEFTCEAPPPDSPEDGQPGPDAPVPVGLPATLDVNAWLDFLQLGDGLS